MREFAGVLARSLDLLREEDRLVAGGGHVSALLTSEPVRQRIQQLCASFGQPCAPTPAQPEAAAVTEDVTWPHEAWRVGQTATVVSLAAAARAEYAKGDSSPYDDVLSEAFKATCELERLCQQAARGRQDRASAADRRVAKDLGSLGGDITGRRFMITVSKADTLLPGRVKTVMASFKAAHLAKARLQVQLRGLDPDTVIEASLVAIVGAGLVQGIHFDASGRQLISFDSIGLTTHVVSDISFRDSEHECRRRIGIAAGRIVGDGAAARTPLPMSRIDGSPASAIASVMHTHAAAALLEVAAAADFSPQSPAPLLLGDRLAVAGMAGVVEAFVSHAGSTAVELPVVEQRKILRMEFAGCRRTLAVLENLEADLLLDRHTTFCALSLPREECIAELAVGTSPFGLANATDIQYKVGVVLGSVSLALALAQQLVNERDAGHEDGDAYYKLAGQKLQRAAVAALLRAVPQAAPSTRVTELTEPASDVLAAFLHIFGGEHLTIGGQRALVEIKADSQRL